MNTTKYNEHTHIDKYFENKQHSAVTRPSGAASSRARLDAATRGE